MRRIAVSAYGAARLHASAHSLSSQHVTSAPGRSITGIALGCTAPTSWLASQVRKAMNGPSSPGRQSPAKANNGFCPSLRLNHTLDLRLVSGSGSAVHSQKLVTGTMQRRLGSFSALRQKPLLRL